MKKSYNLKWKGWSPESQDKWLESKNIKPKQKLESFILTYFEEDLEQYFSSEDIPKLLFFLKQEEVYDYYRLLIKDFSELEKEEIFTMFTWDLDSLAAKTPLHMDRIEHLAYDLNVELARRMRNEK